MKENHTPTPWTRGMIEDCQTSPEKTKANIKFILRAINNFDGLLKALKTAMAILREWNSGEEEPVVFKLIDKEIEKAEKEL